jgi:hypothetical protein
MRKAEAFSIFEFKLVVDRLNLRTDNFNSMVQQRKRGRPREWVLDEEIIEARALTG